MHVTGAGFTRAFVPQCAVCWSATSRTTILSTRSAVCRRASRLLEAERNRHPEGFIDIERLMTRLHELMPYDNRYGSAHEFAFLLAELKRAFLRTIQHALDDVEVRRESDIVTFARHCANTSATCITFNYDDLLDAALNAAGHWDPYWGYGFWCRSSADTVADISYGSNPSDLLLLKLHGSVNWWPRLGYAQARCQETRTFAHAGFCLGEAKRAPGAMSGRPTKLR